MKRLLFFTFASVALYVPVLVYGADFKPLVGIPNVDPNADFSSYINSLYILSISVAALLAVIKIVIAGVKYMLTDIVTNKGEAKNDIKGAIIGLLVVLAAVLILTVINPKITNVTIKFDPINPITNPNPSTPTATGLTAPQTTTSITGTAAQVTSIPANADMDQKILFKNDCDAKPNSNIVTFQGNWGETLRCVTHGANEQVSSGLSHCADANCTTVNQAVIDDCEKTQGGVYYKDTLSPNKGFCVYPKK